MINVFLIDDHLIFLEGVVASLKSFHKKIEVVGSATSAEIAMQKLKDLDVDVIVLDLLMPIVNGAICCEMIKEVYPHIKVVALTGEMDTVLLHEVWKNGADAIILKYSGKEDLVLAIGEVMDGKKFFGKGLPNFVVPDKESSYGKLPPITRREKEVIIYLAQGLKRREIEALLFLSPGGLNFHIKNIYKKFDVHNKEEFLARARSLRLIQ